MWFGYVTFGFVSDAFGRKRTYVVYTSTAAVLILVYISIRIPLALLLLGPLVAFFATGLLQRVRRRDRRDLPHRIRASAPGLHLQYGPRRQRARAVRGRLAGPEHGFQAALSLTSIAFLLAALTWIWIPETRGARC